MTLTYENTVGTGCTVYPPRLCSSFTKDIVVDRVVVFLIYYMHVDSIFEDRYMKGSNVTEALLQIGHTSVDSCSHVAPVK